MIKITYEVTPFGNARILIFENVESKETIWCNAHHQFTKQELLDIIEQLEPEEE